MHKLNYSLSVLFLTAMSVYSGHAVIAGPANSVSSSDKAKTATPEIKVLDDAADPFVTSDATTMPVKADQGNAVKPSQVQVSDSGTVEIHVDEANLIQVLRMLSQQSQKNIISSKEVRGTVTANLYDVTVREALDSILHANGFAYREKGNFIYVYSVKEIADMEKAERKQQTRVFRLYYTPAANAMTMIAPVLSEGAKVSISTPALTGVDTGTKDVGGNSHATEDCLVVTDYAEKLKEIEHILKEIDRRPQQILIEATIMRAALSEDNALGVDFNVLAGVNFNQATLNEGGQVIGGSATQAPTLGVGRGSIGTGNNFTNGTQGFKIGVITNNVSVFLSALEGVTDTTVLANPKVLALNKQKGEVIVGRKDGYLTSTTTQTSTVQTVEFLDTGTRLIFRPFIGDDDYIRMEIHPEDSSGGLASGNLPFKITTEVTSNVMVKDGRTIVIGGLFRESSSSAKSQTPFLGNLPVVGALFRQQKDSTTREEIIILLTPHIVKDDSTYADTSEAEQNRLNDLRVGVRKGMMPWGRERLAESNYQIAVTEMNKPNPNAKRVLWHLSAATNLNPKFIEAIELKAKLNGQSNNSVDNSLMRDFVKKAVLDERRAVKTHVTTPVTQPLSSGEPTTVPVTPATQPITSAAWQPVPTPTKPVYMPTTMPIAVVPQQPEPDATPTVEIRELPPEPIEAK